MSISYAPMSARLSHPAISRAIIVGSATATFAPRLAKLLTISNDQASSPPRAP